MTLTDAQHDSRQPGTDPDTDSMPTPDGTALHAEHTFDSLNPATGDVVGTYPVHSAEEVTAAVGAAREHAAWWAALGFDERK